MRRSTLPSGPDLEIRDTRILRVTTLPEAHPGPARRLNLEAIKAVLSDASRVRYTIYLYLASRVLFLLIGAIELLVVHIASPHAALGSGTGQLLDHASLGSEMSNWDGYWYLKMAAEWFPHSLPMHAGQYSTLGFMPLYPALIWLVSHVTFIGNLGAGIAISMIAGGIATVLIGGLAEQWWGEQAARRAILFWCLFPGTIVFSMVYSEGLTLSLMAGCLILLQRKRWFWAGVCAAFATAIAPTALAAVPVCAVAALQEIRARGWDDRAARRALIAPIMAPLGAVGFAIFLWFWTGTPLADYTAQHVAWSESTTPLAIPRVFGSLIHQMYISGVGGHGPGGIDLNGVAALLGTAFLFWGFKLLWEHRERVPLTAWVWTVCVSVLALTSAKTPPNPRLLVLAFPVVIVVGAVLSERGYLRAMKYNVAATLVMSPLTFVGMWLRP